MAQALPLASTDNCRALPSSFGVRSTGAPPAAGTVQTWSGVSTDVVVLRKARVGENRVVRAVGRNVGRVNALGKARHWNRSSGRSGGRVRGRDGERCELRHLVYCECAVESRAVARESCGMEGVGNVQWTGIVSRGGDHVPLGFVGSLLRAELDAIKNAFAVRRNGDGRGAVKRGSIGNGERML